MLIILSDAHRVIPWRDPLRRVGYGHEIATRRSDAGCILFNQPIGFFHRRSQSRLHQYTVQPPVADTHTIARVGAFPFREDALEPLGGLTSGRSRMKICNDALG